jgi:excisionase family DNA binding protein
VALGSRENQRFEYFDYFEDFVYRVGRRWPMPTTTPTTDSTLSRIGTALIPNAHDMELAAESSRTLGAMTQTTGDLTLTVTGEGGLTGQIRIPASALRLLFAALSEMACGNGVSLLPLNAELTTQQAADVLNVSRPYLVGLLEKGEMPFRLVGNQRRVRLREVVSYKTRTDIDRRAALNELARLGQEAGVGYGA